MDDLISRKAVAEHMKVWAGCDKCDHYNYVRCRACSWDDAMACVDAEESVPAVPLDKLCEWLSENGMNIPCETCQYFANQYCMAIGDMSKPCPRTAEDWHEAITKWMNEKED